MVDGSHSPTDVTLSGGSNDVWIFQIAQTLGVGNGAHIVLSGGAQPQNIFWQVAGQATLGTTSDAKGIILSQTAIVVNTGARLNGRALAQTAVTLNANAVTAPVGTASPTPSPSPSPTATPTPTPKPSVSPTPSATSTPKPSVTATSTPKPTIGSTVTPTVKGSTATPTTVGRSTNTPMPKATVTPTTRNKPTAIPVAQQRIPKQQSFVGGIEEFFSNIFSALAKPFGK